MDFQGLLINQFINKHYYGNRKVGVLGVSANSMCRKRMKKKIIDRGIAEWSIANPPPPLLHEPFMMTSSRRMVGHDLESCSASKQIQDVFSLSQD